jgi:hypothetical protein
MSRMRPYSRLLLLAVLPIVLAKFSAAVPDCMGGKVLVVGDAGAKTPGEQEETLATVV